MPPSSQPNPITDRLCTLAAAAHRTLAVAFRLIGSNGEGSVITELWLWILYPPLHLATAAPITTELRRAGAGPGCRRDELHLHPTWGIPTSDAPETGGRYSTGSIGGNVQVPSRISGSGSYMRMA